MLFRLKSNPILRNVVLLFSGTSVAQVMPVIVTLVLARLYSQKDFGEFSIFMSIVGIVGTIATLRYELVIILLKKYNDAKNILILSILSSFLIAFVCLIVLILLKPIIFHHVEISNYNLLYLVPIGVICTGVFNSFYNWFNREQQYRMMAFSQIFQSLSNSFGKLAFGLFRMSSGLIWGTILGCVFSVVYSAFFFLKNNNKNSIKKSVTYFKIKKLAWEYRDFAVYSTLGGLFNSISNIGFPLIISYFYSIEIAGVYFFANNLIRLPIGLLSSAIAQVYKKEATTLYIKKCSYLYQFTIKMQIVILAFILPILLVLVFYGNELFSFFFGSRWGISGGMIKYFSIFIVFNSLYSPISSIGDILRKQKLMFCFNISLVLFQVLIFALFKSMAFQFSLLISSIVGAVHFIWLDLYMKKLIKSKLINLN
jgi:O-antigen/teichoic acid export membrane protein